MTILRVFKISVDGMELYATNKSLELEYKVLPE